MNNKEYVEMLRADNRIADLMDQHTFSSAMDVISKVLEVDHEIGDNRIANFYLGEDRIIEDNGEFYGIVDDFNVTVLNEDWIPGEGWLKERISTDNEIPF